MAKAKKKKPERKPSSKPVKKTTDRKNAEPEIAEIDPSFAPVAEAFTQDRQVVCGRGWGAGNTVLKVRGKIFAMTIKGDLVGKISKARAAELVNGGTGTYFDPRHDGRLMKEWVVVEVGKADWISLAKEAHQFVKEK